PFEVPTHPVLEARTEWIRQRGGNPFNELTLPDALIKFRQGVGRLIRSARDRGIITLLDSRIVQKPYGRQFLECLPQRQVARMNQMNRIKKFQPYRRPPPLLSPVRSRKTKHRIPPAPPPQPAPAPPPDMITPEPSALTDIGKVRS